MKKFILLGTIIWLSVCFSSAQTGYNVGLIPEELLENAASVVRTDQTIFTVKSESQATLEVKYAITILHESHKENAYFREVYDKFSRLSDIDITLYDKHGKKIRNVAKRDIRDLSTFTSSALFADIRQKRYLPDYYVYPFTIEYSYTQSFNGLLNYPGIYPITDYNMALESGEYIVRHPDNLRYYLQNTSQQPEVSELENGSKEYKWKFNNLPAVQNEMYDERLEDLVPVIRIAPFGFRMDGYIGYSDTWENFGKWIYSLNEGRDGLTAKTQFEINGLTEGIENNKDKVKAVYEYMQSRTRYVNVVIGIGGWQPFTAMEVDEDGYGDCKALSNYTYALLKTIDIPSYYTIIKAGENAKEIISDFPSNQFNHAILCVPLENDTVWLECTSQRNPFNYMGTFTEGRDVLLITEDGGKMVKTPALTIDDNLRVRKGRVTIDEYGDATAEISNTYQGLYYDEMRSVYYYEGKHRMDQVRNNIHIKHFALNDQDYQILEEICELPCFKEAYKVKADRMVNKMGERLLFEINFFGTEIDVPSSKNKQESNIYIHNSVTRVDSLEFQLPEGFVYKSIPKCDTLVSEFGSFLTHFEQKGQTLHYTRKQLINKGTYPMERYNDFRNYLKSIRSFDNRKVLFVLEKAD